MGEDGILIIIGFVIVFLTIAGIIASASSAKHRSALDDIHEMSQEEIDRVEQHGGVIGFPTRVKKRSE